VHNPKKIKKTVDSIFAGLNLRRAFVNLLQANNYPLQASVSRVKQSKNRRKHPIPLN